MSFARQLTDELYSAGHKVAVGALAAALAVGGCGGSKAPPIPPNYAPAFTSSPVVAGEEGQGYSYDANAVDANGDRLTYSLGGAPPADMSIDPDTGVVTWNKPVFGQAGTYPIEVRVSDGKATTKQNYNLVIAQASGTNYKLKVLDESGAPVANAPISLYPVADFEPFAGGGDVPSGDYETLQPKAQPDGRTNAAGEVEVVLSGPTDIVVGTGTERLFNRKPDGEVSATGVEDVYNVSGPSSFNAEGDIKHQGDQSLHGNKYCVGDRIKFMMFGVNHDSYDQTISYCVLDMTGGGSPHDAPIVYSGSFSNPSESLTIAAGDKSYKVFEWEILPACSAGHAASMPYTCCGTAMTSSPTERQTRGTISESFSWLMIRRRL